jgi:hypothetical protein
VRHPVLVAAARHLGLEVQTCVVADPESKGGSEATVRLAKGDLVPTEANLLQEYQSFGELAEACERFCAKVNGRVHRESGRVPAAALEEERGHLHVLPREPYTAALGETRTVEADQTVRYGSVRYSTPPGWVGQQVWCRVEGEELVIVGAGEQGLEEVWRHQLSVPGRPQIRPQHYPDHPQGRGTMKPRIRAQREDERVFLAIGEGAEHWLRGAAASGATRVRAKMAQAVELAVLFGSAQVDEALTRAAEVSRMLPSGQDAAEAFYRVVDAACEKRSLAVTSNIHPAGFDTIMPKTLATGSVDRLLHHAHLVVTEGPSLRLAEATAGKGVVPLA